MKTKEERFEKIVEFNLIDFCIGIWSILGLSGLFWMTFFSNDMNIVVRHIIFFIILFLFCFFESYMSSLWDDRKVYWRKIK